MYFRPSTMFSPSWLYFSCAGLLNSSLCSGMCSGTEDSMQRQAVPWCYNNIFSMLLFKKIYSLYDKMQNIFIFSNRGWFLLIYEIFLSSNIKLLKEKILIKIILKTNYTVQRRARESATFMAKRQKHTINLL